MEGFFLMKQHTSLNPGNNKTKHAFPGLAFVLVEAIAFVES
jgi:hypothetical protein